MTAPLMRSQQGMALAQDLATLQRLRSWIPIPPEAKRHQISDSFMADVRSKEQDVLAKQNANVDNQINDFKSKLNAPSSNFVIGLSLSLGSGTVPGLFFEYNGVGVSATLSMPNVVLVAPILGPWQLPPYPLILSSPISAASDVNLPSVPKALDSDVVQNPRSQILTADVGQLGFDVHASYPTLDWNTLLSQSSFIGRSWLMSQISVATPLLTQGEIAQITAGLQNPTFPLDLANLVAAKAIQAAPGGFQSSIGALLSDQTAAKVCKNGSWSDCGIAAKQALDKLPGTAAEIASLALLWGTAYDAQYDSLRKRGHLDRSTPDSEKFYEAVKSKIDPREIVKDRAEDAVLKWAFSLAKLGCVLEWVKLPPIEALKQFFKSSEIATDYDELRLANDIIQQEIALQLGPYLKPDWNSRLSTAVDQSTPQWRVP
jgi:hypothetical protein